MRFRTASLALLALFLASSALFAVDRNEPSSADRRVLVGAGFTDSWDTDFSFANAGNDEVLLWIGQIPQIPGCLHCPGWVRTIAPDGTTQTTAKEMVSLFGAPGVGTMFIDQLEGSHQPTLTARVVNRTRPGQAIELPAVRYSTIQALNPTVLAFPSARRTADSHSNLVVAEVSRGVGATLSVLVEAYSGAGERLGSATFDVSPGGAFSLNRTIFLADVLSRLGITELQDGQIRVTKTGGTGLMWGLLATVYDEGRVSVSLGINP